MHSKTKTIAIVRGSAALVAALCVVLLAAPVSASPKKTLEPMEITNTGTENAISILQQNDVSNSRSTGGAILVNNTKNDNTGLTVYSDAGVSVLQPLVRMEIDNA